MTSFNDHDVRAPNNYDPCTPTEEAPHTFGGARHPDRSWRFDAGGVGLRIVEWGAPDAPPLLLAHGGADFAQTFNGFAPLLADGGWRVVSWDHRGHGDSSRCALYSWEADTRDAWAVLDQFPEPLPVVGHSKGGGLLASLTAARPERFSRFVNIDGIPGEDPKHGKELSLEERVKGRDRLWKRWLEGQRRDASFERRPGSIAELASRRAKVNPRLSKHWLEYLVTVGASEASDGWRWKLDPVIRMGGVGPWRPSWGLRGLSEIEVPMMVLLGEVNEPMGWGTHPESARRHLPAEAVMHSFSDSGHFVHIEHPERTAALVLEFLS